ncbi:amino acid ABC transporter substrate-binding protein [Herbaspirillum lusitanum]|uniref:Amino acid ABC transporter substrate-binding protein n=1 Tax=Herbaspirillum lusitanum TaxID=213312 RepID=A0ABW9A8X9_9BURK
MFFYIAHQQTSLLRGAGLCLLALSAHDLHAQTQSETLRHMRETRTIVLAYREGLLPISGMDANRQTTGYALELCLRIAEATRLQLKLPQLKVEYLAVDGNNRFTALTERRADIECGNTTNSAQRREKYAFSQPHLFASTRMLVRADSGIRNWPDLLNRRVAVLKGGTAVPQVRRRSELRALNITLAEVNLLSEAIAMLQDGRVDAVVASDVSLLGRRAEMPRPETYIVTGEALSVEQYGLMMRKEDVDFKQIVNRELVRLFDSGEIYRIYDRWFMQPIDARHASLNLPMSPLLKQAIRFPSDKALD